MGIHLKTQVIKWRTWLINNFLCILFFYVLLAIMFISHIWLCVMYGAAKLHRSADNTSTILLNISCECCSNTGKTTLSSIRSLTAHNANTIYIHGAVASIQHGKYLVPYCCDELRYYLAILESRVCFYIDVACVLHIPYCACAYVDVDVNSRMVSSILKCFQHDNHDIAAVFCCRHRYHHITSNQINFLTKYDGT